MFKNLLKGLAVSGLMLIGSSAFADSTGYRKINYFGCHKTDHTCYAYLDGENFGPADCSSNSIRWNIETSPNGKAIFSLVTAAFFAGKKVNFSSLRCYAGQAGYPTFGYLNISPN